ncbi:B3 domain-containing protein Os04g0386900-like [Quercus robur]|uniref:B3 domain-containing protein Os04g0386900-like n=1 Tax=Quercus robur TaxID=38942 RepID=UPI002163D227|nr:B3 domain-containing protein Os04g0386900-like [Quercus robur]
MEYPQAQTGQVPMETNLQENQHWPLSGKPYFDIVLAKSHVKPLYQMGVPAKLHSIIPSLVVPTVLTYCGKNWEMSCNGTQRTHKKFDSGWRAFINDNNLKVGDACVFELIERSSKKLVFRVQILRGDIPPEFQGKVSSEGESSNTPIVIE